MIGSKRLARAAGWLAVAAFMVCNGPAPGADPKGDAAGPLDMLPVPCDPKALVAVPVGGSRDGTHVLLLQCLEEKYTQPQLYVVDLATSKMLQLTNGNAPDEFMAAVFDPPHGATVTYVAVEKHGGRRDWETPVKRIAIDGSGPETVLTLANGTTVHSLSWSPSGKTLAILQTLPPDKSGHSTSKISLWDGERLTDSLSIHETSEARSGAGPQLPQLQSLAWLSDDILLLGGTVTVPLGNPPQGLPAMHEAWMVADVHSAPARIWCVRTDDAPCCASAVSPDGRWLAYSLLGASEVVSLVNGATTQLMSKGRPSLKSVVLVGAWLGEGTGLRLLVARPTGERGPMFPAGPLTEEMRPYLVSGDWGSSPQR